jgi:anti-anti-sigma factor
VSAPEKIDISNQLQLRSALLEAAAAGGSWTVVADMTRTWFCDLCGIETLLAAQERAKAEGGGLLLVISSPALRIFAMTGTERAIPCFTSLGDALAHTSHLTDRTAMGEMDD